MRTPFVLVSGALGFIVGCSIHYVSGVSGVFVVSGMVAGISLGLFIVLTGYCFLADDWK